MKKVNFSEEVIAFMKKQGNTANILKKPSKDPFTNMVLLDTATEQDLNHYMAFPTHWYLQENEEVYELEWEEVPKPIMEDIIYLLEYLKKLINK